MKRSMLVAAAMLLASLCRNMAAETDPNEFQVDFQSLPLASTNKNDSPPFTIKPTQAFEIQFGRGGGWNGLDTVKITSDGKVTLHRLRHEERRRGHYAFFEQATLTFPDEALAAIVDAIRKNRLLTMHKAYHAKVEDGTQWVFSVQQGKKRRSVYCNNHFPEAIVNFAATLDELLLENGFAKADWSRVPDADGRQHEDELWDSQDW